jgi:hypothetical protein
MIGQPEPISAYDQDLLARAAAWTPCPNLSDCSCLELNQLAQEHGMDLATAILYDRLLRHPVHGAFVRQVQSGDALTPSQSVLVGIVPGAFYREHKNTGADGARLAQIVRSMDCAVECVSLRSFGSLAENAALLSGWLRQHQGRPVVLVSLSKGSADLKIALGLRNAPELFRDVKGWVSLSGLPQGTPLVAWLRRQPLRRWGVGLLLRLRGQRYSVVEELRHEPDGPLATWPALPPRMSVIHVVGFPLRRHLAHPWAARAYERLSPLGPNDGGGFLLGDVTRLPGSVYPVWGADHYLQPAWDTTPLLRRVLTEAMSPQAELCQANQSAAQPSRPPANKSTA